MKLHEFNEAYEEYILTEEYLAEGLKVFKKSKKLYKVSAKLKKAGDKKNNKDYLDLSKKINGLANSFKDIEDSFASKKIDKAKAKSGLINLKAEQASVMKDAKKKLGTNKKVVAGVLGVTVLAALAAVAINPGLITSVTSAISAGKGKLLSLFSKEGVPAEKMGEVVSRPAEKIVDVPKPAPTPEPPTSSSTTTSSSSGNGTINRTVTRSSGTGLTPAQLKRRRELLAGRG